MPINVKGEVTKLNVKTKRTKERGEDGTVYETVERIGQITLEFDAEAVKVGELAELINGRYITLDLDDPRMSL